MNDEFQRTDLKRYAPYAVLTTLVVFVLPLWIALWLGGPPYRLPFLATTIACTTLSVAFGRVGSKLWQGRPGSRDVVFDDLLLWGYLRRLWLQRYMLKHVERLALTSDEAHGLSRDEHLAVLKKLARSLETGDPYTHGHGDRVARHVYMIARTMKLPKSSCEKIRLAAALHDVGKLRTPREILTKPGRLDDREFEVVKLHPVDGAAMITELEDSELEAMVRHHHERLDGTGYPDRLSGDEIPLGARIIAVADTFDAITSRRPYRGARNHKDAIAVLEKEAGSQLDADVVAAFITYYKGRKGIRTWVAVTSAAPGALENSLAGLQRIAANTAVVAGAATVVAGGALLPGVALHEAAEDDKAIHTQAVGANPSGGSGSSGGSLSPGVGTRLLRSGVGVKQTNERKSPDRSGSSKGSGPKDGPFGDGKSSTPGEDASDKETWKDDGGSSGEDKEDSSGSGDDKEDSSGPGDGSGDDKEDSSGSGDGSGDDKEDSSGSGDGSGDDKEDSSGPGDGSGDDKEDSSGSGDGSGDDKEDSSGSGDGSGDDKEDSSGPGDGSGDDKEDSSGSGDG